MAASSSATGAAGGEPAGTWATLPLLDSITPCHGEYLVDPSVWPKPNWVSCGPGCEAADVLDFPSEGIVGDDQQSAALGVGGDLYYRTEVLGTTYLYEILRRLSDDAALAVLRVNNACHSSLGKFAAPFLFEFFGADASTTWAGIYRPSDGTFVMPQDLYALPNPPISWFSWDAGWGSLSGNAVSINTDPAQTMLDVVSNGGGYIDSAIASRGGMVAWVDWGTFPATVKSWTAMNGSRTLVTATAKIGGIGFGDETLALLGVTGANADAGIYDSAVLQWTPLTDDPSQVHITTGPDFTGNVQGGGVMATAGDYIAMQTDPGGTVHVTISVVQMSTSAVAVIPPENDSTISELAGMSASTVLAMERSTALTASGFLRWVRYEVTSLALSAPRPPAPRGRR